MFFDYIIVLESLRKGDKRTGKELFDSIINRRGEQLGISRTYQYVKNFDEFKEEFDKMEHMAEKHDIMPMIHIEAHGSPEVIEFESGEQIHWSVIASMLARINYLTKNNLMVVIGTCHAIQITRAVNVLMIPPFFFLIAPDGNVHPDDIAQGFDQFYNCYLDPEINASDAGRGGIGEAMKKMNEDIGATFYYSFAEDRFNAAWNEFREEYDTPEKMNALVDMIIETGVDKSILSNEQIRQVLVSSLDHEKEAKEYFHRNFMMLDEIGSPIPPSKLHLPEDAKESFDRVLGERAKYFDLEYFIEKILPETIKEKGKLKDENAEILITNEDEFYRLNFKICTDLVETHLRRYKNTPQVSIAYLNSLKLGSTVDMDPVRNSYYIGVYFGSLIVLRALFLKMLCSPNVLTWLGDVSVEKAIRAGNPFEIDATMTTNFLNAYPDQRVVPNDPKRAKAVEVLVNYAMQFLVMHELAHIVRGHLAYSYSYSKSSDFDKQYFDFAGKEPQLSEQSQLMLQAMKIDADCFATFHELSTCYHLPDVKSIAENNEQAVELWVFAIHCLLRVWGSEKYESAKIEKYKQPPIGIRLRLFTDNIGVLSNGP